MKTSSMHITYGWQIYPQVDIYWIQLVQKKSETSTILKRKTNKEFSTDDTDDFTQEPIEIIKVKDFRLLGSGLAVKSKKQSIKTKRIANYITWYDTRNFGAIFKCNNAKNIMEQNPNVLLEIKWVLIL